MQAHIKRISKLVVAGGKANMQQVAPPKKVNNQPTRSRFLMLVVIRVIPLVALRGSASKDHRMQQDKSS